MTNTGSTVEKRHQGADEPSTEQPVATGRGHHRAHVGGAADRSRLGTANRRRGAEAERRLAAWLRAHGWPHAERGVRTAYSSAGRGLVDPGDIVGTPALVWQVKDHARESVDHWLTETEQQRLGAPGTVPADLGLLVVRRRGKADPGRWWVWLPVEQLVGLVVDAPRPQVPRPVRMELVDLVPLLRAAGYGEPLAESSADVAPSASTQLQKRDFVGEIP